MPSNFRKQGEIIKSVVLCVTIIVPLNCFCLFPQWVVLSCGHCYCMDCFPELMKKAQVPCAICREVTNISELSFVNLGSEEKDVDSSSNVAVPSVLGSYSTKVEAVVKRLFYLKAADPLVKVLIFSTVSIKEFV